jgi:uncharacterized C2H2 Zn-finger protein
VPRIKAYKDGISQRQLIPVETAKVCTAFQCPWTKKVFGRKQQYIRHLKELREVRMHRRARDSKYEQVLAEFNGQPSFNDVIKWIENHSEFFFDKAAKYGHMRDVLYGDRENFFIQITRLKLIWSNSVSNSHHCPRNGVTNWGRYKEDAPTGYPGWHGRIEFMMCQYNTDGTKRLHTSLSGSDLFNNKIGIDTGTGGCNNNHYGYEAYFFDADWPEITKVRERANTLAALGKQGRDHQAFDWIIKTLP